MTAVGIPMIFAGEEFADQHDLPVVHPQKQIDPVNFDRLQEPWRRRVFDHVARLVRFRTRSAALAVNDTEFIHVDFEEGKRVLAWKRGRPGVDDPVVVVARSTPLLSTAWQTGRRFPRTGAGARSRRIATCRSYGPAVNRSSRGRPRSTPWPDCTLV
jgi:pullulanase